MYADGAGGFIDVVTNKANVGITVLVAGGIQRYRLHHHQSIARHFIGGQRLIETLAQGIRTLAIGTRKYPCALRHTQECSGFGAADNTTSGAQVGGAQAGEGEADITKVNIIGGIKAGH